MLFAKICCPFSGHQFLWFAAVWTRQQMVVSSTKEPTNHWTFVVHCATVFISKNALERTWVRGCYALSGDSQLICFVRGYRYRTTTICTARQALERGYLLIDILVFLFTTHRNQYPGCSRGTRLVHVREFPDNASQFYLS